MDLQFSLTVIISFSIALGIAWYLYLPWSQKERNKENGTLEEEVISPMLSRAFAKRENLFATLAELEQDYLAGKVDEGQYSGMKDGLHHEVADCLRVIDELVRVQDSRKRSQR